MITQKQFNDVCNLIEISSIGTQAALKQLFPELNIKQFYRHLQKSEANRQRYARSKEIQADLIAEEILDIADDGSNDFMRIVKGDESYEVERKEVTNRSRLRVDSRKWLLSKLLPKKYGDKIEVDNNHNFPDGIKINFTRGDRKPKSKSEQKNKSDDQ